MEVEASKVEKEESEEESMEVDGQLAGEVQEEVSAEASKPVEVITIKEEVIENNILLEKRLSFYSNRRLSRRCQSRCRKKIRRGGQSQSSRK